MNLKICWCRIYMRLQFWSKATVRPETLFATKNLFLTTVIRCIVKKRKKPITFVIHLWAFWDLLRRSFPSLTRHLCVWFPSIQRNHIFWYVYYTSVREHHQMYLIFTIKSLLKYHISSSSTFKVKKITISVFPPSIPISLVSVSVEQKSFYSEHFQFQFSREV